MKLLILFFKLVQSIGIMVLVLPLLAVFCIPLALCYLAGAQNEDLGLSAEHNDFIVYKGGNQGVMKSAG